MHYLFEVEESSLAERLVCGVDEAGRGPLAGPVVAAAVILDPAKPIEGLNDSKKLSAKVRERLAVEIREKSLCWAIAEASSAEIDEINILQATMKCMQSAVLKLSMTPDVVLIDGNRIPELPYRTEPIVKGDEKIAAISAASILAKTYRDGLMKIFSEMYPRYGFEKHAGYGTEFHMKMLAKWGPCPIHRMSFAPVSETAKRMLRKEDREKRKSKKTLQES